ncbi:MAG: SUMF1/EgtB/PvdO family nonheme iron enzyme [Bacteroidaceae bacterium]|nr:SUMF1/EgtB/PvdO family nonheme iron enzyme [Bacteroidaceae bacterium]
MRTQYIFRLFPIFILFGLMISCSDEESIIPNQNEENKTLRLCFNASPPTFDSLSTRAVLEWPDSATLYIKFYGSSSGYTVGKGVYSKSSNEWTLTYTGTIEADKGLSCEVWYFENIDNENVSLSPFSPFTCVYNDSTAEYLLNDGTMNINAHLRPESARMKFQGTPGTELKLSGWPRHSSFNSTTYSFSDTEAAFDLTVGADGYTQYVYADISDKSVVDLDLEVNSKDVYSRVFTAGIIQNCKTYSITVPNDDSKNWSHSQRFFTVNNNGKAVTFKMNKVEGGTFQMGSAIGESNEQPVHRITISKDYYMCETEVSQALWYAIMGQSPTLEGHQWSSSFGLGDNYPAYNISFSDCQAFLNELNSKLSAELGSTEAFRFPTEAEWEFAAKGGNKSNNKTYSGSNTIGSVAWYSANSNSTTHPVKSKFANELGLYNMSGNVSEWCYDALESYESSNQNNPKVESVTTSNRVCRGGCWSSNAEDCRVERRYGYTQFYRNSNLGLRICLGTKQPILAVDTLSLSFTETAASKSINIICDRMWTVSTSASWIKLSSTYGHNNGTLTVSVDNNSTNHRTASIVIKAGAIEQTVYVTQFVPERTFTVNGNGKTVTFKMIKVDGGTFQMGSTKYSDEGPVHSVKISKAYYMCETEVTQALWYAVMGQSPTSGIHQWESYEGLGDERPAYYISFEDCQNFLSALNSRLSSQLSNSEQFRFPTEAEWEFAAKGGNKSKGYTYSGSNDLGEVAWYYNNCYYSSFRVHQVKTKAANELGLYDMSGNVYEWCYDWYGDYTSSAQIDPTGPSTGTYRVKRGGGYGCSDKVNRVTWRSNGLLTGCSLEGGLRPCLGTPIDKLNSK